MKISKLITHLEKIKKKHGDLNCWQFPNDEMGWMPLDEHNVTFGAPDYDDHPFDRPEDAVYFL